MMLAENYTTGNFTETDENIDFNFVKVLMESKWETITYVGLGLAARYVIFLLQCASKC